MAISQTTGISNGHFVTTTTREWVAPNGHKVEIVTTAAARTGTIYSNIAASTTSKFTCECGKMGTTHTQPRRAELENHDSWQTQEEIDALLARIMNWAN